MNTQHASIRARQRGIPPFVDHLLNEFGEEDYDGLGCVRLYFSHRSKRAMERVLGHQPVCLLKRYLNAYKVERCADGATITVGHRTCRLRRK